MASSLGDFIDTKSSEGLAKLASTGNYWAIALTIAKALINVLFGGLYGPKGMCMSSRLNTPSNTATMQGYVVQDIGRWIHRNVLFGAAGTGPEKLATFLEQHLRACMFTNYQAYEALSNVHSFWGASALATGATAKRNAHVKAGTGDDLFQGGPAMPAGDAPPPPPPGGDPGGQARDAKGCLHAAPSAGYPEGRPYDCPQGPAVTVKYRSVGLYDQFGQLRIPAIGEIPCDKDSATMRCHYGTYEGYRLFGLTAVQVVKLNAPLRPLFEAMDPSEHIAFYNKYAWEGLRALGVSDEAIQGIYGPAPAGVAGGGGGDAEGMPTWGKVALAAAAVLIGGAIVYKVAKS